MLEERLNQIKPKFVSELICISEKWAIMDPDDRMVEITCLFETLKVANVSKEEFLEEVAKLFDVSAQTAIHSWVEALIMYGPDFLQSGVQRTVINADSDLSSPYQDLQSEKPKPILPTNMTYVAAQWEIQTEPKRRGRKPKNIIRNTESHTIGSLLKSKRCGHFSHTDAAFVYKHIQDEWESLSSMEKASILKELLRYESAANKDREKALAKLIKKIGFLSEEQFFGYLEISGMPDFLRHYENKNYLDDASVGIIGSMRLELGDLFNFKEIVSELHEAEEIEGNLNQQGQFKTEAMQEIRLKLLQSMKDLPQLTLGEIYVINPNSPLADDYPGFSGDAFQLLDQDDERQSDFKYLLKHSALVLFKGRGNLICAIDKRAVCRPSDVKPKSDF